MPLQDNYYNTHHFRFKGSFPF